MYLFNKYWQTYILQPLCHQRAVMWARRYIWGREEISRVKMTGWSPSTALTNAVAMAQVSPEGPVDLCFLQRGWWPQSLAMETLKRVICFFSPMRLLQTASTPLARQGKRSGLVLSKTTQLSQAFSGTFLLATKGSSSSRSSSSQCNLQVLSLAYLPFPRNTQAFKLLPTAHPPLSIFGEEMREIRHKGCFSLLLLCV